MSKNPFENNNVIPIARGHEIAKEAKIKSLEEKVRRLMLNTDNLPDKARFRAVNKLQREVDSVIVSSKDSGKEKDIQRLSNIIQELNKIFFENK